MMFRKSRQGEGGCELNCLVWGKDRCGLLGTRKISWLASRKGCWMATERQSGRCLVTLRVSRYCNVSNYLREINICYNTGCASFVGSYHCGYCSRVVLCASYIDYEPLLSCGSFRMLSIVFATKCRVNLVVACPHV